MFALRPVAQRCAPPEAHHVDGDEHDRDHVVVAGEFDARGAVVRLLEVRVRMVKKREAVGQLGDGHAARGSEKLRHRTAGRCCVVQGSDLLCVLIRW